MKIVFITRDFPPDQQGGAGIVIYRLIKEIQKRGHQVFMITTTQNPSKARSEIFEGIRVFRLYIKNEKRAIFRSYICLYHPKAVKNVKKILKEIKPDVVHLQNLFYHLSYYLIKLSKRYAKAVFFVSHDVMVFSPTKLRVCVDKKCLIIPESFNYKVSLWAQFKKLGKAFNPFRNLIIRYFLSFADQIFVSSRALKEAFLQNKIKNSEVIYNGIDLEDWLLGERNIDEFKRKFNIIGKKIIFFGGRLNEDKGGRIILKILKEVLKAVPTARLLVAADNKGYAEQMKKYAFKLGLSDKMVITGWLNQAELKTAYAVSDVVTVPSICFDTSPVINAEAMASAKPVVGTCFGGTPEFVDDGVSGYIVNPLNISDFSQKVIRILTDADLAAKMGQAGLNRIRDKFSLEKQADIYLSWYNKYVAKE